MGPAWIGHSTGAAASRFPNTLVLCEGTGGRRFGGGGGGGGGGEHRHHKSLHRARVRPSSEYVDRVIDRIFSLKSKKTIDR